MSGFLIQIENEVEGLEPQADRTAFTEVTSERLREIGVEIHTMARTLVGAIQPGEHSPNELTIQFGIGLKGEGGVPFFAKGSIETNIAVTAKWDLSKNL